MGYLKVQSISDIITNSSNEVFVVDKDVMLNVIDVFDDKFNTCFDVKKLTLDYLHLKYLDEPQFVYSDLYFSGDSIYDLPIFMIIDMLGISYEDAFKEGAPIKFNKNYNDWYHDIKEPKRTKKNQVTESEKKKIAIEYIKKYLDFCKKHIDEIKEKIIGKYFMNVEDHFMNYAEFKEHMLTKEVKEKTHYYESRH